MALPVIDTRPLFRPLCGEIVATLRALTPEDWLEPTIAGSWRVREVATHLLDTALRRLSFQRDGLGPPRADAPIAGAELVALINDLNASWVRTTERLSPRVLTDLYAHASRELSDHIEKLSLDAPAIFPVSWAGESRSAQWLDIGREFTEIWHHGAQIRDAVGAGPFSNPRWLRAVLEIAMHALPYAYQRFNLQPGVTIVLDITGPSAGTWTMKRLADRWEMSEGGQATWNMKATMTDEDAWRLLFNALSLDDAKQFVRVEGEQALVHPLFFARSVIV